MKPMGRPRKQGNKNLPDGLYAPGKFGCWRMRHPLTGRIKSLKTKDEGEARELYWAIRKHYAPKVEAKAQTFLTGPLLSDLAREYREEHLQHAVNKQGKPLDANTLRTYENYLENFENAPLFKAPVAHFAGLDEGPRIVREYLSLWLQKPKTYNYRLACLSRLFSYAVDKGLLVRNPVDAIHGRTPRKREVYMTDEHYLQITGTLAEEYHEVYARACDWLYLMSGRPTNMLDVKDEQIHEKEIHYYASKNDNPVVVERDAELDELIAWFQSYKRDQKIVSPYLIVHPADAKRGLARKPITAGRLYRYFVDAMETAGLSGYTLRDIRPKALTDEAERAGEATNKGAHKTQAMRDLYVRKKLPVRVRNTLKRLRAS